MEQLTAEQQAHLDTWTGKRDALALEVSNLQIQRDKLDGEVKSLSESYFDIETRANQIIGRITELLKKEKELYLLTPKEVVDLRIEKSTLQSEVASLKSEIGELNSKKGELNEDILLGIESLRAMNDRVGSLDKIIGDTTEINRKNTSVIEGLVNSVKEGLTTIHKKSEIIISESNKVIKELPVVFLEVKRQSLERTTIKKQKHE